MWGHATRRLIRSLHIQSQPSGAVRRGPSAKILSAKVVNSGTCTARAAGRHCRSPIISWRSDPKQGCTAPARQDARKALPHARGGNVRDLRTKCPCGASFQATKSGRSIAAGGAGLYDVVARRTRNEAAQARVSSPVRDRSHGAIRTHLIIARTRPRNARTRPTFWASRYGPAQKVEQYADEGTNGRPVSGKSPNGQTPPASAEDSASRLRGGQQICVRPTAESK